MGFDLRKWWLKGHTYTFLIEPSKTRFQRNMWYFTFKIVVSTNKNDDMVWCYDMTHVHWLRWLANHAKYSQLEQWLVYNVGPRSIAKLVYNSNNYGLWMFMVLITIVTGVYKPTHNWGGPPHIVWVSLEMWYVQGKMIRKHWNLGYPMLRRMPYLQPVVQSPIIPRNHHSIPWNHHSMVNSQFSVVQSPCLSL